VQITVHHWQVSLPLLSPGVFKQDCCAHSFRVIPGILNQHKEENPKRRKTKSFSNQLKHFLKQSYTWEAEIKKIKVQDQPRQKVSEALFKKKKAGHGSDCL
jgi:hypothetical protein